MARSKRRSRRQMPRKRLDWVYRGHAFTIAEPQVQADLLGTYNPSAQTLTQAQGPSAAQSHILFDSADYFSEVGRMGNVIGGNTNVVALGGEARPEKRRTAIRAVEGIIVLEPTAWTIGNRMQYGWRLGIFEQDVSGVFSLDAGYSMFVDDTTANNNVSIGHWANVTRSNLRESRFFNDFNEGAGAAIFTLRVNWRGRRVLEPHECLGLYTEMPTASTTARVRFFLRTLVEQRD